MQKKIISDIHMCMNLYGEPAIGYSGITFTCIKTAHARLLVYLYALYVKDINVLSLFTIHMFNVFTSRPIYCLCKHNSPK